VIFALVNSSLDDLEGGWKAAGNRIATVFVGNWR
jgi:hypothetical protein